MKKQTYKTISLIIFIVGTLILAAMVAPLIYTYSKPEQFNGYIKSFGKWGIGVMFFIQVAQIIVALIPGELVEFVAGTLYGWAGGLVFCLLGIAVGQYIIFKCVRTFGEDFIKNVADSKIIKKVKFLENEKKLKTVVFILFFVPGTPKDLITYMVPFTKMNVRDFLVISLIARIPSVVSSTIAGSAFAQKDLIMLGVVYGVVAVVSAVGILLYRKWEKKKSEKSNEI